MIVTKLIAGHQKISSGTGAYISFNSTEDYMVGYWSRYNLLSFPNEHGMYYFTAGIIWDEPIENSYCKLSLYHYNKGELKSLLSRVYYDDRVVSTDRVVDDKYGAPHLEPALNPTDGKFVYGEMDITQGDCVMMRVDHISGRDIAIQSAYMKVTKIF